MGQHSWQALLVDVYIKLNPAVAKYVNGKINGNNIFAVYLTKFFIVKSCYKYAKMSIADKQEERFEKVIEDLKRFDVEKFGFWIHTGRLPSVCGHTKREFPNCEKGTPSNPQRQALPLPAETAPTQ